MIWLTWRQHRKQFLYTAIALVVCAAVVLPTGLAMHHTFTDSGLAACFAKLPGTPVVSSDVNTCGNLSSEFYRRYGEMAPLGVLLLIVPALVGLFFGAPIVAREIEHGTHRFVWTQSVTRRRWAAVKLGVIGTAALVLATAYTLGMDWWSAPLVASGGRMAPLVFDFQGVVAIAYTLFAVALGVFAGAVAKRNLPAMGMTLGGYALVRVLVETLARPRYAAPQTASFLVTSSDQFNSASGAWIYSQGIVNAAGRLVQPDSQMSCAASPAGGAPGPCAQQLNLQGLGPGPFSNWEQFQPADRFWMFQGIEAGIFLALTAVLVYFTFRRIRRIS
jgi:hypothetical protein